MRGFSLHAEKIGHPLSPGADRFKHTAYANRYPFPWRLEMNSPACLSAETYAMPTAAPRTLSSPRIGGEENDALFNRVVLPHLADAHALARWITGNDSDAHDVVQEASIRALRGIGTYANGNPRAWVLTIVRYTAYDWLHQNRSPAVIYVDHLEGVEGVQPIDPEVSTPETVLIRHQDERQLAAAISALPAQFRETLLLRNVQGLNYRDIAECTGVSIGTVMSRLFRARRQLISLLNPNGKQRTQGAGLAPTPGISARRRQSAPVSACNGDEDADSSETPRLTGRSGDQIGPRAHH